MLYPTEKTDIFLIKKCQNTKWELPNLVRCKQLCPSCRIAYTVYYCNARNLCSPCTDFFISSVHVSNTYVEGVRKVQFLKCKNRKRQDSPTNNSKNHHNTMCIESHAADYSDTLGERTFHICDRKSSNKQ